MYGAGRFNSQLVKIASLKLSFDFETIQIHT